MFNTLTYMALSPALADIDFESANCSIAYPSEDEPFAVSFTKAVQTKLASIDTSQSVELKRFVMLTAHEFAHEEIKWIDAEDFEPKPLLYDAYGVPASFWSFLQMLGMEDLRRRFSEPPLVVRL